jgi:hypothetical protein
VPHSETKPANEFQNALVSRGKKGAAQSALAARHFKPKLPAASKSQQNHSLDRRGPQDKENALSNSREDAAGRDSMARPGLTQHRKFLRLARTLGSELLALGALEFMWAACYQNGDEYLGDALDVESGAHWDGERGKLCDALLAAGGDGNSGFIEELKDRPGHYSVHDLFENAPAYVTRRRTQEMERRKTKSCAECGGLFHSSVPSARFCSDNCRLTAWRKSNGSDSTRDGNGTETDGNGTCRFRSVSSETDETDGNATPSPAQPSPALKPKNKKTLTSNSKSEFDQPVLGAEFETADLEHSLGIVWDRFMAMIGKNARTYTFTPKRKAMGLARLRDLKKRSGSWESAIELATLCIERLHASPWHNGKNPTGQKYLSWEILFRSTEQMESWLDDERLASNTKGAA